MRHRLLKLPRTIGEVLRTKTGGGCLVIGVKFARRFPTGVGNKRLQKEKISIEKGLNKPRNPLEKKNIAKGKEYSGVGGG